MRSGSDARERDGEARRAARGDLAVEADAQQVEQRDDAGQQERAGGEDRREDVDLDPVRVERRDERPRCGVEHRASEPEVEHRRQHDERAEPAVDAAGADEHQEDHDGHERDHGRELVHVAPRRAVRREAAGHHRAEVDDDADGGHRHAGRAGAAAVVAPGLDDGGPAGGRGGASRVVVPPAMARVRAAAACRTVRPAAVGLGDARGPSRSLLAGEGEHRQGVQQHRGEEQPVAQLGECDVGHAWSSSGARAGACAGAGRRRSTSPANSASNASGPVRASPRDLDHGTAVTLVRTCRDGAQPHPAAADEQRQAQPDAPSRCRRRARRACRGPA